MQLNLLNFATWRTIATIVFTCFISLTTAAQQPAIVQPGAPGQPTKVLPASTRGKLPPESMKDVEFMQGMIHHHAQAVEMVDLLDTRTDNPDLRRLAIRIRHTQADEMRFMERWLAVRGQPVVMQMKKTDDKVPMEHDHNAAHDHAKASDHTAHEMLMPGMLTKEQMGALRDAQGPAFDRLFLTGMIQHHKGALVMVKELFDTAGAGQDAQLFNFATDVDSGQRAEIRIMETMLEGKP